VVLLADPSDPKPYLETLSSRAAGTVSTTLGAPCTVHQAAWGSDEVVERPGLLSPWGADRFVSRPSFEAELTAEARARGAVIARDRLLRLNGEPGRWTLIAASGTQLQAEVVVDATGRRRRIARSLGARQVRGDRLIAYPATVAGPTESLRHRTVVISDPEGWWFLGPASGEGACAVFYTDADLAQRNPLPMVARAWARALSRLPAGLCLERLSRPHLADTGWLDPPGGTAWLAIGDAAASFDPLSSGGLTFALASAELAADALADRNPARAFRAWLEPLLATYATARRKVYVRERRWPDAPFWRRRQADAMSFPSSSLAA
jgi:flavin-dependent dehydrogenase